MTWGSKRHNITNLKCIWESLCVFSWIFFLHDISCSSTYQLARDKAFTHAISAKGKSGKLHLKHMYCALYYQIIIINGRRLVLYRLMDPWHSTTRLYCTWIFINLMIVITRHQWAMEDLQNKTFLNHMNILLLIVPPSEYLDKLVDLFIWMFVSLQSSPVLAIYREEHRLTECRQHSAYNFPVSFAILSHLTPWSFLQFMQHTTRKHKVSFIIFSNVIEKIQS